MKLIIGTANFSKPYGLEKKTVKKNTLKIIFNLAKKNKINFFDCSDDYKNLNFLKEFFFLNSKIFYKIKLNNKNIKNLKQKLIFFKKNIYCLMIHNINHNSIKQLKRDFYDLKYLSKLSPKVKLGISIYDHKDLNLIKKSNLKFDYIQIPLNLFDNTFNKKNTEYFRKKGSKFIARSIFLQGILLRKSNDNLLKKNFKKKLLILDKFIDKYKISRLELSLDFIKRQKWINKAILGVDNQQQLKDIIKKTNSKKKLNFKYKFFTNEKRIIDPRSWN